MTFVCNKSLSDVSKEIKRKVRDSEINNESSIFNEYEYLLNNCLICVCYKERNCK